jgi:hypothetical protein
MAPLGVLVALGQTVPAQVDVRSFEVLAVVFRGEKSSRDRIKDDEIERFRGGCELARRFYFRNSRGKLNLSFRYMEYDAVAPDGEDVSMTKLAAFLSDQGIARDDQDLVFGYGVGFKGNYGGFDLWNGVGGSYGQTAQRAPLSFYPELNEKTNDGAAWIAAHEIQHAIDLVLVPKSSRTMLHAHPYADRDERGFRGRYMGGEHWDWIGLTLREFGSENWLQVRGTTNSVIRAVDSDGDGLADNDSRLPMDERRFGSDPSQADTDGDGLSDLSEYAGFAPNSMSSVSPYFSCNPERVDTDNDGLMDAVDPYPCLQSPKEITGDLTTLTDRVVARNDQGGRVKAMAAWRPDGLTFRFRAPRSFVVHLGLDGSFDNGFWEGGDSYDLVIDKNGVKTGDHVVEGATVEMATVNGECTMDVFLPSKLGQGISEEINYGGVRRPEFTVAGLNLTPGRRIGYSIQFEFDGSKYAILTPQYTMIGVRLAP